MADSGGWREPRVRLLRTLAVVVLLTLVAYMVLDQRDTVSFGSLVGAILVILGFESFRNGGPRGTGST